MTPLLTVNDLSIGFGANPPAVRGVSFAVNPGETLALVGESGSGKSVTARIVLGLLQQTRSARVSGLVAFEGRDLARMTEAERRRLRGNRMSMIFQDPMSSLNPVYRIGEQFHEVLERAEPGIGPVAARDKAAAALADVAIPDPERALDSYAFQLSGGMNQRVMIAMALANEPSLLIADEPGTALDVTVQAQTLELMRDLVAKHHTSVLFISHNLGVVREFADRVYVIYKGRIVEHGCTADLFADPRRTQRFGIDAAPARLYLGQHFAAALDHRVIECTSPAGAFQHGARDDVVFEEGGLAIRDLVLERDPRTFRDRIGRREFAPVCQHSVLHPAEVAGVVYVPHEVDIGRLDGDRKGEGLC